MPPATTCLPAELLDASRRNAIFYDAQAHLLRVAAAFSPRWRGSARSGSGFAGDDATLSWPHVARLRIEGVITDDKLMLKLVKDLEKVLRQRRDPVGRQPRRHIDHRRRSAL